MNARTSLFLLLFVPTPLLAQDPPGQDMAAMLQPAAELKQYAPLIGHWQGTGVFRAAPDAAPTKWSADERARWALGNHFVEVETTVRFDGGEMPTLTFRSFYGFDKEAGRHAMIGATSFGTCQRSDVHWGKGGELIVVHSGAYEGQPLVSREILKFGKDSYDVLIEEATATGGWFEHVRGTLKRVAAEAPVADASAGAAAGANPAPGENAKLGPTFGEWKVTGKMVMEPGSEAMPIAGVETITPIWGGAVVAHHVVGDPSPGMGDFRYEGWNFETWNPAQRCYEQVFIDNMGSIGVAEGRWTEPLKVLVYVHRGTIMGVPTAHRAVLRLAADAQAPMQLACDRLTGAHAPYSDFQATYTRVR